MEQEKTSLWNRNFVFACMANFLMAFPFYMLMPTMPVYLVEELKIDTSLVGMALSSYTIGVLCVRPFSGYIVDSVSRKPLYLIAFSLFALMFGGYLFAATVVAVMVVRFLQGMAMGLTSVTGNTIAIDVIPSKRRGEGIGFYGFTLNLAMSLSPLIAVLLYNKYGFSTMVYGCLGFALLGVLVVYNIHHPEREKSPRPPLSLDRFILVKALPTGFTYLLSSVSYGMIVSFAVLYGKEIGVTDPGYFFIYMAIGVGLVRLVSGKLVDRGKVHLVATSSLACLAVSLAVFALVHISAIFFIMAFIIGMCYGTMVPAFQSLVVNVAPHHLRGTANSTYLTCFDIGVGIGMLSAGFIASRIDLATAYLVSSGCCFLALLFYIRVARPAYERNKLVNN